MPFILDEASRRYKLVGTRQVVDEVVRKLRESGLNYDRREVEEVFCVVFDAGSPDVVEGNPVVVHRLMLHPGEYSVFTVFWHLYRREGVEAYIVIDDLSARRYVEENIPEIPAQRLLWSLRFIDEYLVAKGYVKVEEFLDLLDELERSSFKVDKRVLEHYRRKYSGARR